MRWPLLEPIRARLADEQGILRKQARTRIALCYPSPYAVGMSSLGFQTIYREIHAHEDATAERAFLPDDVAAWRESRVPLCTYESQQPVAGFCCLAFSVSYELELTGLFEMLELSGLPALREERDERHPLVVCGGPLTFSNPVPLAPFADVVALGESEELIHALCDALPLPRHELLARLARHPGFYVPGLSSNWPEVARADDDRLPARSQIVTPHTELRSMFLIEPERGCSRGCTYCVMRRTTNGGMRTVAPERLLALIPEGARKVGLVGAAVTDHPRIVELVRTLVDAGREVGISSLRADRLCARPELVSLLARSGAKTLTTAADGASERLRTALDRRTTAAQLLRVAGLARESGFQRLKLYLMVGLPGEEDRDLDELSELAGEISRIVPLSFGCAPFVAKRNTPMDGTPFVPIEETERRIAYLRAKLRGRAEIRPTSPRWAWVEYMLAQGGEDAGLAALDAWRLGGTFAAWKRAFRERGVRAQGRKRVLDGRLRLPQLAAWPSV
ncbi:MAG TPA: radical SAM protein [Myxococcales bacterium]|nr:radical SAM protein [Myxococcales bacterium]